MSKIEIPKIDIGSLRMPKIDLRSKEEIEEEAIEAIDDLTATAKGEIGDQLKAIKELEAKFKEQWAFDGDAGYYFSVCFKSKAERDEFLKAHGVKLRNDDHVFYEDVKNIFK
jgi:hypothetical protein